VERVELERLELERVLVERVVLERLQLERLQLERLELERVELERLVLERLLLELSASARLRVSHIRLATATPPLRAGVAPGLSRSGLVAAAVAFDAPSVPLRGIHCSPTAMPARTGDRPVVVTA
jgi:chemosensory pili system protein ChpA (sensor histidine kinase/response regulator)